MNEAPCGQVGSNPKKGRVCKQLSKAYLSKNCCGYPSLTEYECILIPFTARLLLPLHFTANEMCVVFSVIRKLKLFTNVVGNDWNNTAVCTLPDSNTVLFAGHRECATRISLTNNMPNWVPPCYAAQPGFLFTVIVLRGFCGTIKHCAKCFFLHAALVFNEVYDVLFL